MTLEFTSGRCTSADWAKCRLQQIIRADREAVPVWRWVRLRGALYGSLTDYREWPVPDFPRKTWAQLYKHLYRWERRGAKRGAP